MLSAICSFRSKATSKDLAQEQFGSLMSGVYEKVFGSAFLDDLSFVHKNNTVRDFLISLPAVNSRLED
jgi:hypothetical protein